MPTAQGSSAEVVAGKKEPIEKSILVAAPDSQQEIQLDDLYCHVEQMAMIEVNGSSCNLKDLFKKAPIYLNAASKNRTDWRRASAYISIPHEELKAVQYPTGHIRLRRT